PQRQRSRSPPPPNADHRPSPPSSLGISALELQRQSRHAGHECWTGWLNKEGLARPRSWVTPVWSLVGGPIGLWLANEVQPGISGGRQGDDRIRHCSRTGIAR